jgi:hypothetical protein
MVQAAVKTATAKKPATQKATVKKVAAKPVRQTTTAKAPIKAAPVKSAPVKSAPVKSAPVKAAPAKPAKPTKAAKPVKAKKPKLVRDSFTIPKDEYVVIDSLKTRAGKLGQAVKKSELLRAGVKALAAMSDIQFKAALNNVPTIKTGRPKSSK